MFSATKALVIAAGIALGASSLQTAEAGSRQDRGLTFGTPEFSITIGNRDRSRSYGNDRRHAPRRFERHERSAPLRYDRGERLTKRERRMRRRADRTCSAEQALHEVRSRGIRRARIQRVNRRMIVVSGRARGDRVVVGFGRERSCPVRFVRAR